MNQKIPIYKIKSNPNNPRLIKDDKYEKLKKSIQDFPEMLEKRPLVCVTEGEKYVVLGGNQRLRACKDLGIKEVDIVLADEWTEEQRREFIIKDNVGYGEHDWDILANDFEAEELVEWGVDVPISGEIKPEDLGTEFSLPNGDKEPFQQMTFTLADEQANILKQMIDEAKKEEGYKYCETFGNENSNGNALYYLIRKLYGES